MAKEQTDRGVEATPLPVKEFYLDQDIVDIEEFVQNNADELDIFDRNFIRYMEVGEQMIFGGGAAPMRTLTRMA